MRFEDFSGDWRIERRIDDFRAGTVGQFRGTAAFESVALGYFYRETGVLEMSGSPGMTAEQSYLWNRAGQGVEVKFSDGRAFHFVDFSAQRSEASHDCPPDWYDVVYDFSDGAIWQAVWRVRGPRKNYEMTSVYTRAGLPKGRAAARLLESKSGM